MWFEDNPKGVMYGGGVARYTEEMICKLKLIKILKGPESGIQSELENKAGKPEHAFVASL
jgi:hypothetical protein